VTDQQIAGHAERLGARVRAEDGVRTAVRILETLGNS
jgi:hypothetical protein